VENTHKQLESN